MNAFYVTVGVIVSLAALVSMWRGGNRTRRMWLLAGRKLDTVLPAFVTYDTWDRRPWESRRMARARHREAARQREALLPRLAHPAQPPKPKAA